MSDKDLLKLTLGKCLDVTGKSRTKKWNNSRKSCIKDFGCKVRTLFLCFSPRLHSPLLCADFKLWQLLPPSAAPRLSFHSVNPGEWAGLSLQDRLLLSARPCWIIGVSQAHHRVQGWVPWPEKLASMSRPVGRKEVGQLASYSTWVTQSGTRRCQKENNSFTRRGEGMEKDKNQSLCLLHV